MRNIHLHFTWRLKIFSSLLEVCKVTASCTERRPTESQASLCYNDVDNAKKNIMAKYCRMISGQSVVNSISLQSVSQNCSAAILHLLSLKSVNLSVKEL